MHPEERPRQSAVDQTTQNCDHLNIQCIDRESKNEDSVCDIESNQTNRRASITRQCFAAIIGKL